MGKSNFKTTVFGIIEKFIEEGQFKKAAQYLWNIAKNNRMNTVRRELNDIYKNASEIEIYANSKAIDELLVSSEKNQLSEDLDDAFAKIRKKKNLKILPPEYGI